MELRQLRQFVALAETLNFRQAAERLHMAQPPLSIAVKKLEAELGILLFDRTTRQTHLTAFGRIFLDHARRILSQADQALQAARAATTGEEGMLTIGFVGTATYAALPELVPAYRATYPAVQLMLRESTTSEILAQIEQGSLDLGIVRTPLVRASRAMLEPIEDDELVLAVPRGHPLAKRDNIQLSDFKGEPFIAYSPTTVPSLHAVLMIACQKAGFTPHVAQEAVQVQTIISLVESGLGVALVPSVATRSGYRQAIFRQLPELATTPVSLAIAYLPEWETAAARRFRVLASSHKSHSGRNAG